MVHSLHHFVFVVQEEKVERLQIDLQQVKTKLESEENRRRAIAKELEKAKNDIAVRDSDLLRLRAKLAEVHVEENKKFTQKDTEDLLKISKKLKQIAVGQEMKS